MSDVKPITLTADTFATEVLASHVPVLVDFWAPWCGPCRMITPIVEGLAAEFADQVKVAKLNIDHYPDLATHYSVHAVPTLLIFQAGRPVDQIIGVESQVAIAARLRRVLLAEPAAV